MAVVVYSVVLLLFGPGLAEEDETLRVLYYDFVCGVADFLETVGESGPGREDVGGVGAEGNHVAEGFEGCV